MFGPFGVGASTPPAPPPVVEALIDSLLARVDDTCETGITRAQARRLLESACGIVNAQRLVELREATLTVAADTPFIELSATLPDLVRLVELRDGERELDREDWRTLLYGDAAPLALADRPEAWALPGRDELLVWPPLKQAQDLVAVYAYQPDLAASIQFEDSVVGEVLDVAEMLMLVRQRSVPRLVALASRLPPAALPPEEHTTSSTETGAAMVDELLARLDDTEAVGLSRADAIRLLEAAAGIVNASLLVELTEATLTVNADDPFIELSASLPDLVRVVEITEGDGDSQRELDREPWAPLLYGEPDPLKLGDRLESWSLLGRDLLVLLPPLKAASTVTVSYAAKPTIADDATSFSGYGMEQTVRLAEMMALARARDERLAGMLEAI